MEITITGIRYKMDGASMEEKTRRCEEFVESLRPGAEVLLMAEPDNAKDSAAIAAYYDFVPIGYVAAEVCGYLHPLLEKCDFLRACLCGKGRHWIVVEVEGAREEVYRDPRRERPAIMSPLGEVAGLPFEQRERQMLLIYNMLKSSPMDVENASEVVLLAKRFLEVAEISLCAEDAAMVHGVMQWLKKLKKVCEEHGAAAERDAVDGLLGELDGMWRQNKDYPRLLERQLERVEKRWDEILERYELPCAGEAEGRIAEYERWLKLHFGPCVHNPAAMASAMRYRDMSRQELYCVSCVLVVLQKLRSGWEAGGAATLPATPERAVACPAEGGVAKPEDDGREQLLALVAPLAARGKWREGLDADKVVGMIRNCLNVDGILEGKKQAMSVRLFASYKRKRGEENLRVWWSNIVGVFAAHGMFAPKSDLSPRSSPELMSDFFGVSKGYANINKGRNSDCSGDFNAAIPLLEYYCQNIV